MELESTSFVDFIVSSPTTGGAVDADSTPTIEVFENDNDTSIYTPTAVKRTDKTGNYRVQIDATTANGFEKGKYYAVIASATVGGVVCKMLINSFTIVDQMEKLTNVTALLTGLTIPETFEPDMAAFPAPVAPDSLDSLFGLESTYPDKDLFVRFYDQASKSWTDNSGEVDASIKADVLLAQEAIDDYQVLKDEWDREFEVQKEVQWRTFYAGRIIEATE